MDEKEKQEYLQKYEQAKKAGVPFFPDILFKDAVVSLLIFVILIALAYFVGAPLEERADPSDASYTPRPEWYFLFLFQLLKYFPGKLEVIGAIVLPALVILVLIALPFLDRSSRRHFSGRPVVMAVSSLAVVALVTLTVLALLEAPPPAEVAQGDQIAALYAENCASCHGATLTVPQGTNLHAVIALGKHEDMPAWSADLTSDEIDALAGFILSPDGSGLFTQFCSACHQAPELVAGDPLELRNALNEGQSFPSHAGEDVLEWNQVMSVEERTALLNFVVAPDGQRLFALNCASCHGTAVAFAGDKDELRNVISQGGLHLDMPPWRERLSDTELDLLASYVVDPSSVSGGAGLFDTYCSTCHGQRIPTASDVETARETIASGGAHETMPVWGDVLTAEQLEALVNYTLTAAEGAPAELGQQLFAQNCASCHGDFGEGGPNPARPGDVIAPISSAEYLQTRDDSTLRAIISQGQPNFGMSPFGGTFGGPLDEEEIDAIVVFMRAWEANPPVELPPEIALTPIPLTGAEIYAAVCAQCHGVDGQGLIGPTLLDPEFQASRTDQQLFDAISLGHEATAMVPWGEILTSEQIQQLVLFIRQLSLEEPTVVDARPSFAADVMPIFQAKCVACHGTLGGWDGTSYQAAMTTGNHAPVVIPGDDEGSLLAQKLIGTHAEGTIMPPSGMLPQTEIQIILDWISDGALDN